VLFNALKDLGPRIKAYSKYSVAYCKGLYVVLDVNRYIYVIKPLTIYRTKPKFMDKIHGFRVPLSIFKPPFSYGMLIIPVVSGGKIIEDHDVKGWRVYMFKGKFKLQNHEGLWVEGNGSGIFAYSFEWNSLGLEEAIKKVLSLIEKIT